MPTYGQTIRWTELNGTKSTVSVENCPTRQEALQSALRSAKAFGWTEPKWWQWWRWEDTRVSVNG